jgi:hypothetical protein
VGDRGAMRRESAANAAGKADTLGAAIAGKGERV